MAEKPHATFDRSELAIVLSHYDLGVIESLTDFQRGSRRSPKVGVVCERGKFLLKRRALRRADPDRVFFAHRVQQCLSAFEFPLARLVPTRESHETYLQLREHVYELFSFIPGRVFERTVAQARSAGFVLSRFHEALEGFTKSSKRPEPHGDYHNSTGVRTGLCNLGPKLAEHDSFAGNDAELAGLLHRLLQAYDSAATQVDQLDFANFEECVVHADWHPGNILFRGEHVAAVIDYDSVRWAKRITDVANGALQFAMNATGDVDTWPADMDLDRFEAFMKGYGAVERLSEAEMACIPPLMCEALIGECVPPITRTGSVGRWAGFRVLKTILRKVEWIMSREEQFAQRRGVINP
ncbi:MAG: phosphotransferase [Planctomycetota bacterium]